jgi:hypothetical protein
MGIQVKAITANVDANGDRRLSRKEVLVRCRADRRYADLLKLPPRIREADGTFARFTNIFLAMNVLRTGYVTEGELAEYLGIPPATTATMVQSRVQHSLKASPSSEPSESSNK